MGLAVAAARRTPQSPGSVPCMRPASGPAVVRVLGAASMCACVGYTNIIAIMITINITIITTIRTITLHLDY